MFNHVELRVAESAPANNSHDRGAEGDFSHRRQDFNRSNPPEPQAENCKQNGNIQISRQRARQRGPSIFELREKVK